MIRKKPKYFYTKSIFAKMLIPLSMFYILVFAIVKFKISKPKKICKKTICVGNIVLGGSGKTPVCIALCEALKNRNCDVCFISKGYGRHLRSNFIIPHNHNALFNYKEVGDESLILSDYADVFVVNKREKSKTNNYDVAICDDGYFDETIKKDCNIVVFDGTFFVGNGYVFPAGNLRYKMKSLKKADFVIITNAKKTDFEKYKTMISKYVNKNNILSASFQASSKHNFKNRYLAFSGIGENQKFFNSLQDYGLKVVNFIQFSDHQEYNIKMLNDIKEKFKASGADKIITTRKDYVKLPKFFCYDLNIEVFDIECKIDNIDRIVSFVLNDKK